MTRQFKCINGRRLPSLGAEHAPFIARVYPDGRLDLEAVEVGTFGTAYEAANAAARYDFEHNGAAKGCVIVASGGRHGGAVRHPVFYSTRLAS